MKLKQRKKFSVRRTADSLFSQRNALITKSIGVNIDNYLKGDKKGVCIVCAGTFDKHDRYHACCDSSCYKLWTRGTIKPRGL
jgi:hypothetical protein